MELSPEISPTQKLSKKRNLSEVSRNSVSPSPALKMANKQTTDLTEELTSETDENINRLESLIDMGTDTVALHTKMDIVIGLLKQMMHDSHDHKETTCEDISKLKTENKQLHGKLKEAEGKMTRMSRDMEKLNLKCEDLQVRAMNNNILIHNIPEQQGEDIYTVIQDLLSNRLKIADNLIHSPRYPTAPVQIDIAHRLGQPGRRPRLIVVKLALRRGKDILFNHVRNLKGSGISISEQLPNEMRERRDAQFQKFKALREEHKHDHTVKIKLIKDKLFVNSRLVPGSFEERPLAFANQTDAAYFDYNDMIHTDTKEYSQSFFQGHLQRINSIPEAKASLAALLQHPDVAKAHHIIYAYSLEQESGVLTGHSDDGEIGASELLKAVIKEKSLKNIFLAVSRTHDGPNLGRKRFELIKTVALDAIAKSD